MTDKIKRILAIAFSAGNGLLGAAMVLGALLTWDEDILFMLALAAAFLLNAVLMAMYARTLTYDIRLKEIMEEEEDRLRMERIRRRYEEEDDLSGLLTGQRNDIYARRQGK